MYNGKLTMKKLLVQIIASQELPLYLEKLKKENFFRENPNSRPWDFEKIVTDAFNNKGQKVGDESQLWGGGNPFKQFDSL